MKSEKEIKEEIEYYEQLAENEVSGSPSYSHYRGAISALKWVLRNE